MNAHNHNPTSNPNILFCAGHVRAFSDLGGYPLVYLAKDGGVLCAACVENELKLCTDPDERQWFVIAHDVNWEDPALYCEHCEERIESAYAEEEVAS